MLFVDMQFLFDDAIRHQANPGNKNAVKCRADGLDTSQLYKYGREGDAQNAYDKAQSGVHDERKLKQTCA